MNMAEHTFLNGQNNVKPLRGFDSGGDMFSIDMDALTGKIQKEKSLRMNKIQEEFKNIRQNSVAIMSVGHWLRRIKDFISIEGNDNVATNPRRGFINGIV